MNILENTVVDLHTDHILVVDDEPLIREPLSQFLEIHGFLCETAVTGSHALEKMKKQSYALVIADIQMPELNGIELLEHVRKEYPHTAMIMITGVSDLQTAVQTMKQGAADYITKPFNLKQVIESVRNALHSRLLRLENQKIAQNLESMVRKKSFALHSALHDLETHRDMTLEALVRALDAREHETQCHSLRVQNYSVRLAQQFGFDDQRLTNLARGALLHDIGKIGISDKILLKPGPLSREEWQEMKKHPSIGYQILLGVNFLDGPSRMILCHHERPDGAGYPQGIREDIPLESRIFAVIDAYDAITSNRPYREACAPEYARAEIADKAGSQFDPEVVQEFLKVPQQDWDRIKMKYS